MPTFGALQTKISKKLIDANNTAVAASDVGDAINDAIHYWKFRRFWFNEKQATVTLTVGNPLVPGIPSDFLYELPEDGFVIQYNNISYRMVKAPPATYDDANTGGIGLPSIYTFRNGQYLLYFYPNIAYSMNVNYIKDYADLVNAGDSNDFTNLADRLVMYEALSHLTGENRQDQGMEASYAAKAEREYENLKVRGYQQTSSGVLSVETIL